ncbi:MAG: hypothetical protein IMW96_11010 [Thermoanaerobacteraceae bacterium]|nr:hypothetical protein [Thermoanaerobacteraceae bacterium]
MILQMMQGVLVSIFLPGMLYSILKCGLRGQKQWQFIFNSLVAGFVLNAVIIFLFGIMPWKLTFFDGAKVIVGYTLLGKEDLASFLSRPYGPDTFMALACIYAVGCVSGLLEKGLYAWRRSPAFSITPSSALDVEMFRLRDKRIRPEIILTLSSGKEVKGKCRVYTFTEPREIVLETEEDGAKVLRWFKLDERIIDLTFRTLGYNSQCFLRALKNTSIHHLEVEKDRFPCRNQQVQGL